MEFSFTGDSSGAGRNQLGAAGPFPRVSASPQEEAGCRVPVEEPQTKATMAHVWKADTG